MIVKLKNPMEKARYLTVNNNEYFKEVITGKLYNTIKAFAWKMSSNNKKINPMFKPKWIIPQDLPVPELKSVHEKIVDIINKSTGNHKNKLNP